MGFRSGNAEDSDEASGEGNAQVAPWRPQVMAPCASDLTQRCPKLGLQVGVDFVETGDGAVPVALEVQMVFQPADELDGALG